MLSGILVQGNYLQLCAYTEGTAIDEPLRKGAKHNVTDVPPQA